MLKTEFWQKAASRLPAAVRERHIGDIQRAERIEILIDGVAYAWSAIRGAVAKAWAPRVTPQH
jgi:hypothetical protein